MKILAIRGKNLASLSSEFAVDFQSEPLASAGLFAITGPTGAGKSTLLDALCLALYERTPRLLRATAKGESIPDVGDNGIAPADPRTLLRRGASEGFAEVDFVGSDNQSYCARWTVRRARNRADGKLQASEVTLLRLADQQRLGDKKTDTLKRIETIIGLSFEQFTRAVLLAQNDFAAFLKASDDERAELLQTLTGTGSFALISMRAFQRMKTEKEQLQRLELQLSDQAPLPPEARAQQEAELNVLAGKQATVEQHKAAAANLLRWYQTQDKLQQDVAEAIRQGEAAQQAREVAAPRFAQLARLEQVQEARPLFLDEQRLTRELAAAERAIHESQTARVAACHALDAQRREVETSTKNQQDAENAKDQARPALEQARALDTRLTTLMPQYDAAAKVASEAERSLHEEKTRKTQVEQALVAARQSLETGERWLAERAAVRALAEHWPRWETLFAQAQKLRDEENRGRAQLAELSAKESRFAERIHGAQTAHSTQEKLGQSASENLQNQSLICAGFDPERLLKERQGLEARRDQLQSATALWQRQLEHAQRQTTLLDRQRELAEILRQSEIVLAELEAAKPLLERELLTAEQALAMARLAASESAEAMRAQLAPEAPCPVCGSLEHPYVAESPQASAILDRLQQHVEQHRQRRDDNLARRSHSEGQRLAAQKQLAQIALELAGLTKAGEALAMQWQALPLRAEITAIADAQRADWLGEQLATVKHGLEKIAEEEKALRDAQQKKAVAQTVLDAAQQSLEKARQALEALRTEQQSVVQARQATQQRLLELAEDTGTTLAQLDPAFVGSGGESGCESGSDSWRDSWQAGAPGFVDACRADVTAWLAQQKRVGEFAQTIVERTTAQTALAEAVDKAAQRQQAEAARRSELAAQLQSLRQQRQALFGGRTLAEIESALAAAINQARQRLLAAQEAVRKAEAESARFDEAVRQSTANRQAHQLALATAVQQLDDWRTRLVASAEGALSREALAELLACDPGWIAGEREVLQGLAQAVVSAEAVLKARQQTVLAHESTLASACAALPEGAEFGESGALPLAETLARIDAELTALAGAISAIRLDLNRDDERLAKSAALRAEIGQQAEKTRLWSQLGELIGSADGKKFRNFAQQLTLDILLGYANQHLHSLSRRYRLERIVDTLGLLVVDQDMGDEVRSVHSLSGGESFLVSLALALGLASLSSHQVCVESLFIDEGFGSLDNDSLMMAMEALENLQALGRKVGVISHVGEMNERIGTRIQVRRMAGGQSRVLVG